jgi:hypothetical protein
MSTPNDFDHSQAGEGGSYGSAAIFSSKKSHLMLLEFKDT